MIYEDVRAMDEERLDRKVLYLAIEYIKDSAMWDQIFGRNDPVTQLILRVYPPPPPTTFVSW